MPAPATLRVDATVTRLIDEGALGEVLGVEARIGGAFVDRDAPFHWRQDVDRVGVNIMLLGVWYECITRWVGGARAVTALGRTVVQTRHDGNGRVRAIRVPDHIDVIAEMACGAQAHLQVSAVSGLVTSEVFLYGSEATLRFAANALQIGRRGDDVLSAVEIPADAEGGWRVEEDFVEAIRGLREVTLTPFDEGVRNMEFNEAVVRSMRDRRTVELPLL